MNADERGCLWRTPSIWFASLFVVFFLFSTSAEACTCVARAPACEEYWKATAVFAGKVTSLALEKYEEEVSAGSRFPRARVRVAFEVEEAFRGVPGQSVEVVTPDSSPACGYSFSRGQSYLVYAYREKDGTLATSICTRTERLGRAKSDVNDFRDMRTARPGGRIFGRVEYSEWDADRGRLRDAKHAPNARVALLGAGEAQVLRANTEGKYEAAVAPGTYRVRLALPAGATSRLAEREVEVADRGCAEANFSMVDGGRIRGRVSDAQGKPVAFHSVDLLPAEAADKRDAEAREAGAITDEDGAYEMPVVLPGRYVLGVHLKHPPGLETERPEYARTFLPGVGERVRATVLEMAQGKVIEGADLRLGAALAERMVVGVVVNEEGKPVAGASVHLEDPDYPRRQATFAVTTDEQGRFTLRGYAGMRYLVRASIASGLGSQAMHAELSIIEPGDAPPAALRLVLASAGSWCGHYRYPTP